MEKTDRDGETQAGGGVFRRAVVAGTLAVGAGLTLVRTLGPRAATLGRRSSKTSGREL
jgi:hypothetical protein